MLQIGDYLTRAKPGFTVPPGRRRRCLRPRRSACTARSGTGWNCPELCVELFEHVRAGRVGDARSLQRRLMPVARSIGPVYGVLRLQRSICLACMAAAARPARAGRSSGDRRPAASARSTACSARVMLPVAERVLLGPGPSMISPWVMRARRADAQSSRSRVPRDHGRHAREFATRVPGAGRSPALAVSGTGTTAMETAVANLVAPGTRVLSIVTGYFAERLAEICRRMAPPARRLRRRGRAADPDVVFAASSPRREPISSPLSTPRHQPGC